jgi:hypothetical protein
MPCSCAACAASDINDFILDKIYDIVKASDKPHKFFEEQEWFEYGTSEEPEENGFKWNTPTDVWQWFEDEFLIPMGCTDLDALEQRHDWGSLVNGIEEIYLNSCCNDDEDDDESADDTE